MKKKIKDLNQTEINKICDATNCDRCPYKLMSVVATFQTTDKTNNEHSDSLSYCIQNLYNFNQRIVEIPEDDN